MVDEFFFLQLLADSLEIPHFVPAVENDVVGAEFGGVAETASDELGKGSGRGSVDRDGVNDDLVGIEGIVVVFAEFELPGTETGGVIEDVFESIEIDEGALQLVDMETSDIGDAGDVSNESRAGASAGRTGFVGEASFDEISGAVAEDDGAPGVEWGDHDFAGAAVGNPLAGFGIDDFDEGKIGIEMIAGGKFTRRHGTFAPREFGFGKAVGDDDIDLLGTELRAEVAEFLTHALGNFFATENEEFDLGGPDSRFGGVLKKVIEKGGHGDEGIGIDAPQEFGVAIGAHDLAAAGGKGEGIRTDGGVVGLPEGEVWSEGKHIDDAVVIGCLGDLIETSPSGLEVVKIVAGIEEGNGRGRATGGAGQKDGTQLLLENFFDSAGAVSEGF